jgi:hypothetical protein
MKIKKEGIKNCVIWENDAMSIRDRDFWPDGTPFLAYEARYKDEHGNDRTAYVAFEFEQQTIWQQDSETLNTWFIDRMDAYRHMRHLFDAYEEQFRDFRRAQYDEHKMKRR